MKRATELQWLKYFARNADFGPASYEIKRMWQDQFEKETGLLVPEGWRYADDDESEDES